MLLLPVGYTLDVVLAELRQPLAVRLDVFGIVDRQGGLKVGLDDISRWRQDVADQVLSRYDPGVNFAADAQFVRDNRIDGDNRDDTADHSGASDFGSG